MPRKSSHSQLPSLSQEGKSHDAVLKLCQEIQGEKEKDQIKAEKSCNILKEILRKYRKHGWKFDKKLIRELASTLENNGSDLCRKLHPNAFSLVIETVLQGAPSRRGERCLTLLAAAMVPKSDADRGLSGNKDVIGKDEIENLLEHCIDVDDDIGCRKWMGMLCLYLILGCTENRDRLRDAPPEIRTELGRRVVDEPDEVMRLIYAQLLRLLALGGLDLKYFFPDEYEKEVYERFPVTSDEGESWVAHFRNYVEEIIKIPLQEIVESAGDLFASTTIDLRPGPEFAPAGHQTYVYVDDEQIHIIAPFDVDFCQNIVEVPLNSIQTLMVEADVETQQQVHTLRFDLDSQKGLCCLNAEPTVIKELWVTMHSDGVDKCVSEIHRKCPRLREMRKNERVFDSQRSSTSVSVITFGVDRSTGDHDDLETNSDSQIDVVGKKTKYLDISVGRREGVANRVSDAEDGPSFINSGRRIDSARILMPPPPLPVQSKNSPAKLKPKIQPKAKPPIVTATGGKSSSGPLLSQQQNPVRGRGGARTTALPHAGTEAKDAGNDGDPRQNHPQTASTAREKKTLKTGDNAKSKVTLMSSALNQGVSGTSQSKHDSPRRSTSGPSKPATGDIFDFPEDEVEETIARPSQRAKGAKRLAVARNGSSNVKKPVKKAAVTEMAVDSKKRSSPLAIQPKPSVPKYSQRSAASQASQNLREPDVSRDELEEEEVIEPESKPAAAPKALEIKTSQIQAQAIPVTEQRGNASSLGPIDEDDEVLEQRKSDAHSLGLVLDEQPFSPGEPGLPFHVNDGDPATKSSINSGSQKRKTASAAAAKKGRNSATELANLLGSVLGDIDDEKSPGQLTMTSSSEKISGEKERTKFKPLIEHKPQETLAPKVTDTKVFTKEPIEIPSSPAAIEQQDSSPSESPMIAGRRHVLLVDDLNEKLTSKSSKEQSSGSAKKRQAEFSLDTISRKRRGDRRIDNGEQIIAASAVKSNSTSRSRRSRDSPTTKSPPLRRSPRLQEGSRKAQQSQSNENSSSNPVKKDIHRKPQIIAFNALGPRNQGMSSTFKSATKSDAPAMAHQSEEKLERKRKRDANVTNDTETEIDIPSSKRHSSEPSEEVYESESDHAMPPALNSGPPVHDPPSQPSRPKMQSRPSSQGSRVNCNGSPMGPRGRVQVDHFKKMEQKLIEDEPETMVLSSENSMTKIDGSTAQQDKKALEISASNKVEGGEEHETAAVIPKPRQRSASEIFGPKVALRPRAKAQPSSPNEVTIRYVPHQRTGNGVYKEINGEGLVEDAKALPDPFKENSQRPNIFTDRLRAGSSKELVKQVPVATKPSPVLPPAKTEQNQKDKSNTKSFATQKNRRATSQPESFPKHLRASQIADPDKTLVNMSPSDLTNGSTQESQSSSSVEKPKDKPADMWYRKVRPHYKSLSEAIHRVADEVIIRLENEEDRMGLLARQYQENGAKVLGNMANKHAEERASMSQKLEGMKDEMKIVYQDTSNYMTEAVDGMKKAPTQKLQEAWQKQQDEIKKKISQGRKVSE